MHRIVPPPPQKEEVGMTLLVILVGPVGVELNEQKWKLSISDTQHYGITVPRTTRVRGSQKTDGIEYAFILKHLFETDAHEICT